MTIEWIGPRRILLTYGSDEEIWIEHLTSQKGLKVVCRKDDERRVLNLSEVTEVRIIIQTEHAMPDEGDMIKRALGVE